MAQEDEEYDDEDFEDASDDVADKRDAASASQTSSRNRPAQPVGRGKSGTQRLNQSKKSGSAFLLVIGGVVLGVLILGGIFWAINAGKSEELLLNNAMAALDKKEYDDAEGRFLSFIESYRKSPSAPVARIGLHRTRVEKNIMPEFPDVIKGLEELNQMLSECRELPGFGESKVHIRRYADRLTFAAARVAEVTQDQNALDVSTTAMEIMQKYVGEDGLEPARMKELQQAQRLASAAIAKKSEYLSQIAEARSLLQAGKTIDAINVRDRLLDAYPGLSIDKDLQAIQQEILDKEKELVVRSEGSSAVASEVSSPDLKSLSLTFETELGSGVSSRGKSVFAIGIDCVFALDADTGEPIWKRPVGMDSPFAPIAVNGTQLGVLVFNTLLTELQLLSQEEGRLLWRQPLQSRPNAAPLVVSENIFITTQMNEMFQVAIADGRVLSRLKFTQPIIGPPALSSDGSKLVIAGDETLVYSLNLNPLSCVAVSEIPHKAGSVRGSIVAAGQYFLMCDNVTIDSARVQAISIDSGGVLSVAAQEAIDGQVNDPCLLSSGELFVPSTPQRVTAFRVADTTGQPPLVRLSSNQLEDGIQTRMFLHATSDKKLLLAGRDLRTFANSSETMSLAASVSARGIHLRPIVSVDDSVFLTMRDTQASSVYFTRVEPDSMKEAWKTVIGCRLVAAGSSVGDDSVLAVSDFGEAFHVSLADVAKGGFQSKSSSRFAMPEKLNSYVGGVRLHDGRLAAWCGASEPSMWTFSQSGQYERKWILPDAPQLPPVALESGVVFAMPGRLHMSATKGEIPAEDYRAAQSQSQQYSWKSLTVLTASQLLAVNAKNQFVRVEFREKPQPHLAELSITNVPHLIEVAPVLSGEFLFLATSEGKLVMMQATTLEVLSETNLGIVPSSAPKTAGNFVFVELANNEVKVFDIAAGLPQAASIPLDGCALADTPLLLPDDSYLIARTDGAIIRMTAEGQISNSVVKLGQAIHQGPLDINGQIIVIAVDGSLYLLDQNTGKQ